MPSLGKNAMKASSGLYAGPIVVSNAHFGKTRLGVKLSSDPAYTALIFTGTRPAPDGSLEEREEVFSTWSASGVRDAEWEPSKEDGGKPAQEGQYLTCTKEGEAAIDPNSPLGCFLASLEDARSEELSKPEELNGMCLVLGQAVRPTKKKADRQVYIVEKVLEAAPWERPGGKAKSAPAAEEAMEITRTICLTVMGTVLANAGKKGLTVADLPTAIKAAVKEDHEELVPYIDTIVEKCSADKFLSRENNTFTYDGDTGKLKAAA